MENVPRGKQRSDMERGVSGSPETKEPFHPSGFADTTFYSQSNFMLHHSPFLGYEWSNISYSLLGL